MIARQVAVCGPGQATADELAAAEVVGRLLAERGCVLVCGGLGGAMAAACRGAKAAGGTTIGILPGTDPAEANPWVDHAVATGLGQARNVAVVLSGRAVIAIGGGWGTLAEIAHARRAGDRPIVLLGGWAAALAGADPLGTIRVVATPEEAVALTLAGLAD